MKKPKIVVESYEVTNRRRDRMSCMENRNGPSVWEEYTDTKYRIVCGKKVLEDGFSTEFTAKLMLNLNWTPEGLYSQQTTIEKDYKIAREKVEKDFLEACDKLYEQTVLFNKLKS